MRIHLPIKNLFCSLLFIGLLSLNVVAVAQVYKSYDANGNVVFSDKPTKRSSEVEISRPNLSDSFEIQPPVESPPETNPEVVLEPEVVPEPEPVSEPEPVAQPENEYDPADTNKNGRVSRREKEEERKERRKKKREAEQAAEGSEE